MKKIKRTRGEKNIKWIEDNCFIPEGADAYKPTKLRPWQKDIILKIYDNPKGTRRAIISFGRKNAKTTLSAFLLLLHLCGREAVPNSQLNSAAQGRDQAALIFDLAAKVVRMSPTLQQHVDIKDTMKQLVCKGLGTKYKALSAEVKTNFGLSPVFIVHDELGQVRGPKSELYEALETATAANDEPLSIIISTQAPTENDLLSILIDDAQQEHDPRTILVLYSADIDDDPFVEETIRKANPAFGDFQNAQEVLAMAEGARRMPSREADYRNLILNQRIESVNPFISRTAWFDCVKTQPIVFGKGEKVYGGLDLSSTTDLTALVLGTNEEGVWKVKPTFWLPGDGLVERSRLDRVEYDVWAKEGYLQTSAGKSIEYEHIAKYLREEIFDHHDVAQIAFDRWGFNNFKQWLLKADFTEAEINTHFIPMGQGFQSMSPALSALERAILNNRLVHNSHPILNLCAANAVVNKDPAGNRKLDKARSRGRIDGMVALAMMIGMAESHQSETKTPEFQLMFV